jgi:hypothetical protein
MGEVDRPLADLLYHIIDDDGIPRVVAARFIRKETPPTVVSFNPLDVKPCRSCRAYLQAGLQNTVHPHHLESCELHPDHAWPDYVLVKLDRCNRKVGYHSDPHTGCLDFFTNEHNL